MDRAYAHFARLIRFTDAAAYFVVRTKGNLHYRAAPGTPMANALLTILHKLGATQVDRIGDSNGVIAI